MKTRSYVPLKIGATACLIVITATALNLTPTFVTSYYNGKPVEMSYKHQAESEVYGGETSENACSSPQQPHWVPSKLGEKGPKGPVSHLRTRTKP